MHKVLITGAGGGGGENLITSLRISSLDLAIFGSNMDKHLVAKTSADFPLLLPPASDPSYVDQLAKVIVTNKIDLVIPNNDTEVGVISANRDALPCTIFLPPDDTIRKCHDKLKMHECFLEVGIPQATYRGLEQWDDIEHFMVEYPAERYWIRPRRGSGSRGATWVNNAEQARSWIKLWCELQNFTLTDFIISEFLPGRDYAFQSVWKDGRMVVGKMIERLQYFFGRNMLSGMSSSPSIARTLLDMETFENVILKAIHGICETPHGNFNLDLKGCDGGTMCVTEFNIGRFCMITPIFDQTGKYNTAEMHVRSALDLDVEVHDSLDYEDGCYLIRELDTLPTILRADEFENKVNSLAKSLNTGMTI
ncbi:hypothetical protein [uncultured Pseudodesulfovibrio sp.]|uniref:hypothetical protein n=1 Tax=uncultured Pseudodesulfovibrio sp. TaxID=2035858 RepID=UPI0029C661AA|nr:hypothetical protein [uncultured Pseudodesulfovibrio sp.]